MPVIHACGLELGHIVRGEFRVPVIHACGLGLGFVLVAQALFAAALRLLLSRLRGVEVATGSEVLRCVDWVKLRRNTEYVPGLWDGAPGSLV